MYQIILLFFIIDDGDVSSAHFWSSFANQHKVGLQQIYEKESSFVYFLIPPQTFFYWILLFQQALPASRVLSNCSLLFDVFLFREKSEESFYHLDTRA